MNTITIKIPKSFFDDHRWRGCIADYDAFAIVATAKHYTVTLSVRDFADLLDDAIHYASNGEYGIGLVAGARAVVNAIKKQMPFDQVNEAMNAAGYTRTLRHIRPW